LREKRSYRIFVKSERIRRIRFGSEDRLHEQQKSGKDIYGLCGKWSDGSKIIPQIPFVWRLCLILNLAQEKAKSLLCQKGFRRY